MSTHDSTPTEREAGDVGEVAAVLAISCPDQCCPGYCIEDIGLHNVAGDQAQHIVVALAPLIAERERAAGARALREAADARDVWQDEMYRQDERHFATGSQHGAGVDVCADVVEDWLRERAAQLDG